MSDRCSGFAVISERQVCVAFAGVSERSGRVDDADFLHWVVLFVIDLHAHAEVALWGKGGLGRCGVHGGEVFRQRS